MKKILSMMLLMVTLLTLVSSTVLASGIVMPSTDSSIEKVNQASLQVWGTVVVVVRILAFAAFIIAGVRYMFAAADTKANIKQQTIVLCVGAILVFAAEPVINFVVDIVESLM